MHVIDRWTDYVNEFSGPNPFAVACDVANSAVYLHELFNAFVSSEILHL